MNGNEYFSDEENRLISVLVLVCSFCSFLGSAYICSTYLRKPALRTVGNGFVFRMSFFDLISASTMMSGAIFELSNTQNPNLCKIEAALLIFAATAVNFWTVIFSIHCVMSLLYRSSMSSSRRLFWSHVLIVSWSGIAASIPIFIPSFAEYGQAGADCSITNGYPLARQILFYIPLYLMMLVVIINYTWMVVTFRRSLLYEHHERVKRASSLSSSSSSSSSSSASEAAGPPSSSHHEHEYYHRHKKARFRKIFIRMGMYPLLFVCLWLPCIINRLYEINSNPSFALSIFQALTLPSQGFVNFAIYGYLSLHNTAGDRHKPRRRRDRGTGRSRGRERARERDDGDEEGTGLEAPMISSSSYYDMNQDDEGYYFDDYDADDYDNDDLKTIEFGSTSSARGHQEYGTLSSNGLLSSASSSSSSSSSSS